MKNIALFCMAVLDVCLLAVIVYVKPTDKYRAAFDNERRACEVQRETIRAMEQTDQLRLKQIRLLEEEVAILRGEPVTRRDSF